MSKPVPADPELYARIKAKIKRESASRWPSAYLSGHLVKTYKAQMEKRGKKPYKSGSPSKKSSSLGRWYKEDWINISTGKKCGDVKTKSYYPVCRPRKKITEDTPRTARSLSTETKRKMIKLKQKAKGKTVHYSYKK